MLYITSVVTTIFYNCFIFLRCKTSPFWFWFSDFVAHHFNSLCSCHHQSWLTSTHQKLKVRNKQSNCCSFSNFTQNLPQVLSKICNSKWLISRRNKRFHLSNGKWNLIFPNDWKLLKLYHLQTTSTPHWAGFPALLLVKLKMNHVPLYWSRTEYYFGNSTFTKCLFLSPVPCTRITILRP